MTVRERVRKFIIEELNWERSPGELTDDFPLLESGAVDSLGVFNLVSFLEDEFGVEIPDEELVPENFGTVQGIVRLVSKTEDPH